MSSSISLTNAVTSGDESAVSALLANGADVNESTNGGQTALILAIISGHTNLVRLLMHAGADPQLRDNLGLNALDWAQRRGLTEAHTILTSSPESTPRRKRIVIPVEEPKKSVAETPPVPRRDEVKTAGSDDDKSRRWLAGVKQRFDEQAIQRLNRNELPVEPSPVRDELMAPRLPVPPTEEVSVIETAATELPKETGISGARRILTPPPDELDKPAKRKRCPQCNAIYNADLVSYCAHHIVPLVDIDDPVVVAEQPKSNAPLFWILLLITLTGSLIAGSLITTYLYKSNETTRITAEQQRIVQKGTPELGTELAGKVVSLPEAECPVKGSELVSGTVTVFILVDKHGQVYRARGAGGDWLMRGCSTEAAMKSTFAPDKLLGREAEGTITYTFKP